MQELQIIQAKLKAHKGQYNSFGGFKYRSLEDIFEAVKPLLAETQTTLVVGDEIVLIGDRYYVCATATLTNQKGEQAVNKAYAREDKEKSKMDGSQLTGSASSYARKYALNGLFCIDDTKDADTDEYTKATTKSQQPKAKSQQPTQPAQPAMIANIESVLAPLEEQLQADMEAKGTKSFTAEDGTKVTYTPASTSKRLDSKKLEAEQPDIYKQYVTETERKAMLRVTFAKAE